MTSSRFSFAKPPGTNFSRSKQMHTKKATRSAPRHAVPISTVNTTNAFVQNRATSRTAGVPAGSFEQARATGDKHGRTKNPNSQQFNFAQLRRRLAPSPICAFVGAGPAPRDRRYKFKTVSSFLSFPRAYRKLSVQSEHSETPCPQAIHAANPKRKNRQKTTRAAKRQQDAPQQANYSKIC